MATAPNFVIVEGVISHETKVFGKEYKTAHITVAGVQRIGDRDTVFFQQVRARKNEGKFAAMLLAGTPVRVTGILRQESWTDDSGKKQSRTYVAAQQVRALPNPESYAVEQKQSAAKGDPYFIMPGFVSVTISGNLSRAELRYTNEGKALLSGSFACKEEWVQDSETKEHTNWLNFTIWGEEAERLAEQKIDKGWSIAVVDGTIRNSRSVSKGVTYDNTDVEVGNGRMLFLPKRGGDGGAGREMTIDDLPELPPLTDDGTEDLPF